MLSHINWLWVLAGLLGSGGLGFVALLFFAPAAAVAVEKLAVDFLSTRVGLALAVGTVCLLGGGLYEGWNVSAEIARAVADRDTAWGKKVDDLNTKWQGAFDKAGAAFYAARDAMDAQIKATLDAANAQRDQALDAADAEWQKRFNDYAKTLKPDAGCVITPEDQK